MKSVVEDKVNKLSKEMESLINEQQQLRARSREIDIRMTQVMGAMNALQECLREHDDAEVKADLEAVGSGPDQLPQTP